MRCHCCTWRWCFCWLRRGCVGPRRWRWRWSRCWYRCWILRRCRRRGTSRRRCRHWSWFVCRRYRRGKWRWRCWSRGVCDLYQPVRPLAWRRWTLRGSECSLPPTSRPHNRCLVAIFKTPVEEAINVPYTSQAARCKKEKTEEHNHLGVTDRVTAKGAKKRRPSGFAKVIFSRSSYTYGFVY